MIRLFRVCGLLLATFVSSTVWAVHHGLSIGDLNDFQSGSVEGWIHPVSNPSEPSVQGDEGPQGAGDNALWISSTGSGRAGSRLLALNRSAPWIDAVDAGVTAIEMDLKHINAPDLFVRIGFGSGAPGTGTWYVSNTAHQLSATNSGNWEHAEFLLSDLVLVSGTQTLAEVLGNVAEVRILSALSPSFQGDRIAGVFAVDNISAVPVPAAVWLFVSSLGFLGLRAKKP